MEERRRHAVAVRQASSAVLACVVCAAYVDSLLLKGEDRDTSVKDNVTHSTNSIPHHRSTGTLRVLILPFESFKRILLATLEIRSNAD